jgi:diguanylate cyclase (GGDEF)-like protein
MLNDSNLIKIDDMKQFDSDDLETLLHKVLNYVKHIIAADAGTIYLKEHDCLKFHIFQNDSFSYETIFKLQKTLKDLKYKIEDTDDTIAVESFISKKIITVDDIYEESEYDFKSSKEFDNKFNYKTKSILTAPLVNFYTHETIGVLQLINKKSDGKLVPFTKEDKEFISLTSYLIALSIVNAQDNIEKLRQANLELEHKVIERTQKLEDIQLKLIEQANRDPLTDLYNRRYFNEIGKNLISISKRENQNLSVMIMDIDDFKNINDTYGHSVGDKVIIFVADILRSTARESDICVRFGGEEFVIVLPNTAFDASQNLAEKIRKKVEDARIVIPDNKDIKFTISVGISQVSKNDIKIESTLKRADEALYEAKTSGKNQTRFNI